MLICSIQLTAVLAFCFLFTNVHGHRIHRYDPKDGKTNGDPSFAETTNDKICPGESVETIKIGYMKQVLDHFGDNKAIWEQYYQVNDRYWNNSTVGTHVFLLLGGEYTIINSWVCNEGLTYIRAAKQHGARIVQISHRYFGPNRGLNDTSVDNLRYLSLDQSLQDAYHFIEKFNKQENMTNPKYGNMAAYMRVFFPNASQGAISSSSVLYPTVEAWQYAEIMENVITETSKQCADVVTNAYATMCSLILTDEGRANISGAFHLNPPFENSTNLEDDKSLVMNSIFDAFQTIIQYTYDGRNNDTKVGGNLTASKLCEKMTTNKTDLDKLYDVYSLVHHDKQGNPVPINSSYAQFVDALKETSFDAPEASNRGWLWLSCNGFGFLQTTSNSKMFGSATTLGYLKKLCADIFDQRINSSTIEQSVKESQMKYGFPWTYNGTNVVFSSSQFDPWHFGRVNTTNVETHVISIMTPGTHFYFCGVAHCADMYSMYEGEPAGLNATRQVVFGQIDYYLSLESTWKEPTAKSVAASLVVEKVVLILVVVSVFLLK
ncbi:Prolylcarboxypeptidase [Aphelenchoides besseyi]|nr:Prolylcarboxypeptidase [Aphelenchoides besseyi]KAI6211278.1 Prolylcarboxypeptidase [Aphelenchoides besseyi]